MGDSGVELELSAELRRRLSLGADEPVRLLAAGVGAIVLGRVAAGPAASWPRDRDLALTADVRSFPLADVLQLIHGSARSGLLVFDNGGHCKSIYLHRGEVVFATSNQVVDRLGECLLRAGTITPEQFREARKAYSPQVHFGRILVERGFLAPREIWNGVKHQVEEIVRSLFSYGAGTLLFWEGEIRPDNVVRLSLPTQRLVAEGLRRRDELLRFLALLEDPAIRLQRRPGARLAGVERAVYDAAEHEPGFPGLCRRAGIDPLAGARAIQVLRMLGALALERVDPDASPREGAPTAPGSEDALRQCVRRHVELLSELAAPIVAVEGGDGIRKRLGQVLKDARARFPELLGGLEVGPGGGLDPAALIERALRFPGEREGEVRRALGELVSYLEFDLLNHPGIADPEIFLRGVDELRAGL